MTPSPTTFLDRLGLAALMACGFGLANAQEYCVVTSAEWLDQSDELALGFADCPDGVVAGLHWQDVPIGQALTVLARHYRLDGRDWLQISDTEALGFMRSGLALWRPTRDVPPSPVMVQEASSLTLGQAPLLPAADPAAIAARQGSFVIVAGTIVAVDKIDQRWYLNFGDNYREDFTLGIRGVALDHFQSIHGRPRALVDSAVVVLGQIERFGGPFIELSGGWQLIVLPDANR